MAISIGDVLGGLGAAIGGTGPQYVQGLRQREQQAMLAGQLQEDRRQQQADRQEEISRRQRTEMQAFNAAQRQDAFTAYQILTNESIPEPQRIGMLRELAQDGLEVGSTIPGVDTSAYEQTLADLERYQSGDPTGITSVLQRIVPSALIYQQQNPVPKPEAFTLSPGQTRFEGGEQVASVPAEVAAATPQSPIGKVQADIASGQIPEELGRELIAAEIAGARSVQTEAEQKERSAETQQQLMNDEALRALSLAESLIENPNLKSAVGPIQSKYVPTIRSGTADVEVAFEELKDLLTMGNLERMTGVLSESDIKLIASAASGLDLRMSDAAAISKLGQIRDRLVIRLKEKGMIPADYGTPGIMSGTVQRTVHFNDLPE